VTINNVTRVDVTLEIGTVTETVTVTTDTAQLQTDTAEVKGELNNRAGESARATRQELPALVRDAAGVHDHG